MPSVALEAPAKLNLGLRIVGRRDDGYHLLESLFVPLELSDRVEIEAGGADPGVRLEVESEVVGVPAGEPNLAVRAARAFLAAAGLDELPVRIRLRKRIPVASGLGGGSSDAGAVLRGLAALEPEALSGRALAEIALGLGADVPYFLDPRPALVRGVGERIEPMQGLRSLWTLLANPGVELSTARVFRLYDALLGGAPARVPAGLTPPDPRPTMRALFGPEGDADALARLPGLENDLEAAAIRLCPPVARLRDRMRGLGAVGVGMSGSGATVFGIFGSEAEGRNALAGAGFEPPTWTCLTRFRGAARDSTKKKE